MQKAILLVEDDEMLIDLLGSFLEMEGYNVIVANDVIQAVELYSKNYAEIVAVLTDMGLPKLGGWEMSHKLREINKDVKIIFSSGYFNKDLREKIIAEGGVDYIQKPYDLEKMVELIKTLG
jgi:CheY-like chemotaxis protein